MELIEEKLRELYRELPRAERIALKAEITPSSSWSGSPSATVSALRPSSEDMLREARTYAKPALMAVRSFSRARRGPGGRGSSATVTITAR